MRVTFFYLILLNVNSKVRIVRAQFPWSELYILYFLLASNKNFTI